MNDNMQMTNNGFDDFVKRCNFNTIRTALIAILITNITVNVLYFLIGIFSFNYFYSGIIIMIFYFAITLLIPIFLLVLVIKNNKSSSFFAPVLIYTIILCLATLLSFIRLHSFFTIISILLMIAYIVGLFFLITTISSNKSRTCKKSYLAATIIISISSVIAIIMLLIYYLDIISHRSGISVFYNIMLLISYLTFLVAFMILPIYLQKISEGEGVLTVNYQTAPQYNSYANPNGGMQGDGFSNPNNGNSNSNDSFANARNSIDYSFIKMGTGIHVLLFLFTCGIWSLVWIYKVTRYLNCFDNNSYREPINKLLLCMFVPFYSIYWFYVTGKRIDEINRSRNVQTDTGGLLAILAFLVSIAAYIVAQIKIDQLDMEPGYNNYQQNNMPQYNTPQGPQGPQGMNQTYNQNYQQPVNTPNQQYNTPYQQANAQGYGQGNYQPNTQPNPQANTSVSTGKSAEQIQELERLKELLDNGVINQEEFEKMKSDILN